MLPKRHGKFRIGLLPVRWRDLGCGRNIGHHLITKGSVEAFGGKMGIGHGNGSVILDKFCGVHAGRSARFNAAQGH